jgi:hypothetical protein
MTSPFRFPVPVLAAGIALALSLAGTARAATGSAAFQALDTNRDGLLGRDELQAHPRLLRNFDAIDANHDGLISDDELQAWHAAHLHKPGSEGKAFTSLDANGDGRIERSELPDDPRARACLDAADTNHDGVVTKEEARAAREAHGAATVLATPAR